jgi:predicted lipid-binding transport protein (Tim44 family)
MKLKKILVGATLALAAMSMMGALSARPMGGGKSFGRQSQSVRQMPAQPAPTAQRTAPAAAATPGAAPAPMAPAVKPPSPWKGILGGALVGLGLGALFSHFGMGAGMASAFGSILMIALIGGVILFIVGMLRRKSAPAMQSVPAFGGHQQSAQSFNSMPGTPEIGSGLHPAAGAVPASAPAAHTPWGVPADFDTPAFLRHAKGNFIRLQAAWDKADVSDIREFTTPEVFAELRMQIQERGAQADYTDVVSIDAELLGIENDGKDYLASVKFTGQIKSAPDALAEPFSEVWNLAKPVAGNAGWLLAGIQQLN